MVISEMKGRSSWKKGSGIAPELTAPQPGKWEKVKIKIPSAINVNDWGRGSKVGAGTPRPYTPSSVYFPSYPEHWVYTRMGWLCRNFRIPASHGLKQEDLPKDLMLPLYKPLPMFNALKATLRGSEWTTFEEVKHPVKPEYPSPVYPVACLIGQPRPDLIDFITKAGLGLTDQPKKANLWIIDAESVTAEDLQRIQPALKKWKKKGGMVLALSIGQKLSDDFCHWLPEKVKLTDCRATALEMNRNTSWGNYFEFPDLYFSEMEADRYILKQGLSGVLTEKGNIVLKASRTDWSLFNTSPEHWKCAQVVLCEALQKSGGAALVTYPLQENVNLVLSVIDYRLQTKETNVSWNSMMRVMGIATYGADFNSHDVKNKKHGLLMDGPVD